MIDWRSSMTWLIVGLFASTFVTVVVALLQDAERAGLRELEQPAATSGLSPQVRGVWSSGRVLHGSVQDFDLTWTITSNRIGRNIVLRVRHPKPVSA
jgi:hypothetical protein